MGETGQFLLPSPHPVAVRATRVGTDQQPSRRRVAVPARAIDVAHERNRDAAEADANRRRDPDEARRLLYMALVVGRARQHQSAELVATIVNSLVHHQSAVAVDEAAAHVAAVVRGDVGGSERWLEAQIERITHELNH